MLEVQKSYHALLRVLRGERDFVDIANKNLSALPVQKQIEGLVCALGECASKAVESASSASGNIQSAAIAQIAADMELEAKAFDREGNFKAASALEERARQLRAL